MTDYIIGLDECGWGAWFGALVVCAAALPVGAKIPGLKDSKAFKSRKKREEFHDNLKPMPMFVIKEACPQEIDSGPALVLRRLFLEASSELYAKVRVLQPKSCRIIADGNLEFDKSWRIESIVKADQTIPSVMLASVIGKVYRDRQVIELAKNYTGYSLERNVGYGTPEHRKALATLGPTPLHRGHYLRKANLTSAVTQSRTLVGKSGPNPS